MNSFQGLFKDLILMRSPLSSRPGLEEDELLEELMIPELYSRHPDADVEDEGYVDGFRSFGGSQGIAYLHHQRLMGHTY